MDEYYSLRELLKFFQRQHNEDYVVIEAVVNLIGYQSRNLPEEKKPQIILNTLRRHGLYEIGFEGEKTFREDAQKIKLPEETKLPESNVDWFGFGFTTQLEEYNIRVLNCTVKFESFMS